MEKKSFRLESLDAFRGFDMIFIMGFYSIVFGISKVLDLPEGNALVTPFHHVKWDGFHFIDSVFPTFLFIAGVSFPFSLLKSRENGVSDAKSVLKMLKRTVLLILLGMVYNGCLTATAGTFRFASVLQRIAVGWMFAGLVFVFVRSLKARIAVFAALAVFWWLFVQFVTAPGAPEGIDPNVFENAKWNIVVWFDHQLPGFMKAIWPIEPEGMLSHVGGVLTAMLGMFTGEFVLSARGRMSGTRQVLSMWGAAAVLLAVGNVMIACGMPVIKAVWSCSFVFCVGAYSLAMFALFYYLIDVKLWRKWSFFFKVIGVNSITVYLCQRIFSTWSPDGPISFLFGCYAREGVAAKGLVGLCALPWGYLAWGVIEFFTLWTALYWLYRRKIFLKV